MGSNNFEKIRSKMERDAILHRAFSEPYRMIVKGKGDNLGLLKVAKIQPDGKIVGKLEVLFGKFEETQQVVVNLRFGEERFFFQSEVYCFDGIHELAFPANLFLLQRRAFRRFDLEQEHGRLGHIVKLNGAACAYLIECLDISAGGARIHFHGGSVSFKSGDQIQVNLNIKNKWNFDLAATICYFSTRTDRDQIYGISFDKSNKTMLPRISLMIMDLQKQNLFG